MIPEIQNPAAGFGCRIFYDRVRRSVWVCMGLGIAMVGTLSILEFTFREFLLGIFTTDSEVIRIGAEMMMYIVLWNTIFIPNEVLAGTMRGTGDDPFPADQRTFSPYRADEATR